MNEVEFPAAVESTDDEKQKSPKVPETLCVFACLCE